MKTALQGIGKALRKGAGTKGVTLIELVVAVVISALVVTLASRLFLTGQKEFLARVFETDRLSALLRLKGNLQSALRGEVERCEGGRLRLDLDSGGTDLGACIKARFPEADSLDFRCYEVDGDRLSEWKGRFQPQLVEYRISLKTRGRVDRLEGSVLK